MNAMTIDTNEVYFTGLVGYITPKHDTFEIKVRGAGRPMFILVACFKIPHEVMAEISAGDTVEVYGSLRYLSRPGRKDTGVYNIEVERVYRLDRVSRCASTTPSAQ